MLSAHFTATRAVRYGNTARHFGLKQLLPSSYTASKVSTALYQCPTAGMLRLYSTAKGYRYADSFPKKQREHDSERRKDKLSDEWELVFTMSSLNRKLEFIHCLVLFGFTVGSYLIIREYIEREDDDNVIILFLPVDAQTDILILGSIFYLFHMFLLILLRRFPRRIYFNSSDGSYLAIMRTFLPFLSKKITFQPQHISYSVNSLVRFFPSLAREWPIEKYKIIPNWRRLYLPAAYFKTGADRDRLLVVAERPY